MALLRAGGQLCPPLRPASEARSRSCEKDRFLIGDIPATFAAGFRSALRVLGEVAATHLAAGAAGLFVLPATLRVRSALLLASLSAGLGRALTVFREVAGAATMLFGVCHKGSPLVVLSPERPTEDTHERSNSAIQSGGMPSGEVCAFSDSADRP